MPTNDDNNDTGPGRHQAESQVKNQEFWARVLREMEAIDPEREEFKNQQLPLSRIKKVMKLENELTDLPELKNMISGEAPIIFAKACEIFILELSLRAWAMAADQRRRTMLKSDISRAVTFSDMYDFLIDIVPREDSRLVDYAAELSQTAGGAQAFFEAQRHALSTQHQGVPSAAPASSGVTSADNSAPSSSSALPTSIAGAGEQLAAAMGRASGAVVDGMYGSERQFISQQSSSGSHAATIPAASSSGRPYTAISTLSSRSTSGGIAVPLMPANASAGGPVVAGTNSSAYAPLQHHTISMSSSIVSTGADCVNGHPLAPAPLYISRTPYHDHPVPSHHTSVATPSSSSTTLTTAVVTHSSSGAPSSGGEGTSSAMMMTEREPGEAVGISAEGGKLKSGYAARATVGSSNKRARPHADIQGEDVNSTGKGNEQQDDQVQQVEGVSVSDDAVGSGQGSRKQRRLRAQI